MNTTKVNIINSIAQSYFQFAHQHNGNKNSALFADIMAVLNCSEADAENYASTHCNMISFYNALYSTGKITMVYQDYFREMLNHSFCDNHGFFQQEKDVVCRTLFGFDFQVLHLPDYNNVLNPENLDKDSAYQMLIHPEADGSHFITTYIDENGILMGADTSYRGTPFVVADKIPANQFGWLLKC